MAALTFQRNLVTHAVTLSNFCNLLNLDTSITALISSSDLVAKRTFGSFFSFSSSPSSVSFRTGQCSLSSVIHIGPFHHNRLSFNLEVVILQVTRSAGLSFPGQCLHSMPSVNFKISSTLWQTNCFHSPLFRIQRKLPYYPTIGTVFSRFNWGRKACSIVLASFA